MMPPVPMGCLLGCVVVVLVVVVVVVIVVVLQLLDFVKLVAVIPEDVTPVVVCWHGVVRATSDSLDQRCGLDGHGGSIPLSYMLCMPTPLVLHPGICSRFGVECDVVIPGGCCFCKLDKAIDGGQICF